MLSFIFYTLLFYMALFRPEVYIQVVYLRSVDENVKIMSTKFVFNFFMGEVQALLSGSAMSKSLSDIADILCMALGNTQQVPMPDDSGRPELPLTQS
ncbi:MAG: hypothetical protein ACI823_002289 [Chitinophagales bacterium]|jgi:hypothetical protein